MSQPCGMVTTIDSAIHPHDLQRFGIFLRIVTSLTALSVLLAACGSSPDTTASTPNDATGEINDSEIDSLGDINVDRGLLTVEITIPADLASDTDDLLTDFSEMGIGLSDLTVNSDGSVTYRISRGDHRRLMAELRQDLREAFDDAVDEYDSVRSITSNNDFTRFEIVVDRPGFENSFDGFVVIAIMISASFYAIFDGIDTDDMRFEMNFVDESTGEVFETVIAPDDFDE